MNVISLTQDDYLNLLSKQTDPVIRNRLKQCAHSAMYGSDPNAKVILPVSLYANASKSNDA